MLSVLKFFKGSYREGGRVKRRGSGGGRERERKGEREREKCLPSVVLAPKWLQKLELGYLKSGARTPNTLAIIYFFLRHISQELDSKWRNQDFIWYP